MANILVVDDDRATRALVQGLLSARGHAVTAAADGPEALAHAALHPFDLILVDVWMPGMSGLDVLAKLRERAAEPRAIVMTADDAPETLLHAVKEQALRYLRKPIDSEALAAVVERALAEKPATRPIEVLSARREWVELLVPCERQSAERIHSLLSTLLADLPEESREAMSLAFRELLMNAVEWGGKLDPGRNARIAYLRLSRMVLYRIADPGQGFRFEDLEHAAVANAGDTSFEHVGVRQKKGLRPGGFGLLMTRQLVDELIYNEAQNEVVFVKYLD
jgi:CheY-like chemotaxis protein/anti-sigma regulatory factor (Ser/Thr protein kinase)